MSPFCTKMDVAEDGYFGFEGFFCREEAALVFEPSGATDGSIQHPKESGHQPRKAASAMCRLPRKITADAKSVQPGEMGNNERKLELMQYPMTGQPCCCGCTCDDNVCCKDYEKFDWEKIDFEDGQANWAGEGSAVGARGMRGGAAKRDDEEEDACTTCCWGLFSWCRLFSWCCPCCENRSWSLEKARHGVTNWESKVSDVEVK